MWSDGVPVAVDGPNLNGLFVLDEINAGVVLSEELVVRIAPEEL